jgi:hypothetical protein
MTSPAGLLAVFPSPAAVEILRRRGAGDAVGYREFGVEGVGEWAGWIDGYLALYGGGEGEVGT